MSDKTDLPCIPPPSYEEFLQQLYEEAVGMNPFEEDGNEEEGNGDLDHGSNPIEMNDFKKSANPFDDHFEKEDIQVWSSRYQFQEKHRCEFIQRNFLCEKSFLEDKQIEAIPMTNIFHIQSSKNPFTVGDKDDNVQNGNPFMEEEKENESENPFLEDEEKEFSKMDLRRLEKNICANLNPFEENGKAEVEFSTWNH